MTEENKYCSVCGKEKELRYISYINKSFYIECECEKIRREKAEKEKKQKAIETYIMLRTKNSGLLKREFSADFDTMTVDDNNEKAVRAGKYILEKLLEKDETDGKNSLVLCGNRGSGKTYIAAAVINGYNKNMPFNENVIREIIKYKENGYSDGENVRITSQCKFIKESDLLPLLGRYNYRTDTVPSDEFKKAKALLVIDDVGASFGDKEKIQSALLNVIDYRFSENLPLIITTNLSKTGLQKYLGERAFDRLLSCSFFVDLTAPESRRQ